jgi:hypothetical protein
VLSQRWRCGARGSEVIGRVIEPRNWYSRGPQGYPSAASRGKPTLGMQRKAAVLDTRRRVPRTPPGSESEACHQRGHSGTWERQQSPGHDFPEEEGYRVNKSPGVDGLLPAVREPATEHKDRKQARYCIASAK